MRSIAATAIAALAMLASPMAAPWAQDRQEECTGTASDLAVALDCLRKGLPPRPFDDDSGLACARFETARLMRPAVGRRVFAYDQATQYGTRSKGVVIETPGAALVIAPSDAVVVYAGEFRSYGKMVILEPGCGLQFLLAGASALNVMRGQLVLAGEPLGVMATSHNSNNPVLYVEIRRNGRAIDPGPDIAGE